ncbi:MAG TPA: hypothetical protein VFC30_06795 [Solirubrobacteraceae bacterium]|nr:hypothetical protein [Solirubrobacteraceae bacterium]
MSSSPASPEQAAAITAAIERFERATAPPPISSEERPDPWVRAAILEGVAREDPELVFPVLDECPTRPPG